MDNYLAIGNDELGERVGDTAICPKCKELHEVKYGEQVLEDGTKIPSKMLGYVKCGESAYLVALNGKTMRIRG